MYAQNQLRVLRTNQLGLSLLSRAAARPTTFWMLRRVWRRNMYLFRAAEDEYLDFFPWKSLFRDFLGRHFHAGLSLLFSSTGMHPVPHAHGAASSHIFWWICGGRKHELLPLFYPCIPAIPMHDTFPRLFHTFLSTQNDWFPGYGKQFMNQDAKVGVEAFQRRRGQFVAIKLQFSHKPHSGASK